MNLKGVILKEARFKVTHTVWFHSYNNLKKTELVMKTRSAVARGWEQAGGCDYQEAASREVSEVMELFWFLVMIMGTQICTCAKIHRKYGQLPNSSLKNKIKKQTNIHETVKTKTPQKQVTGELHLMLSVSQKNNVCLYIYSTRSQRMTMNP